MRWRIEPTGCLEVDGKRQVMIQFYLHPGDARYDEHHVHVPKIPQSGYPGEKDEHGIPKSQKHAQAWVDSLPKEWRTNPFHNHIIYVPLDTTDEEIEKEAEKWLNHFYGKWERREKMCAR